MPTQQPAGRLRLEDLEKVRNYSEVKLLSKMQELLDEATHTANRVSRGHKNAIIEMRKRMNDQINLACIMRDMLRIRAGIQTEHKTLDKLIARDKRLLAKEGTRERGLAADQMVEKIIQVRLAEAKRREKREQERKEARGGTVGGGHQKAPDQL